MKIAVCVKQVYDTESKLLLTDDKIEVRDPKWITNPYDEFAIEEAIKAKEHYNCSATVFSIGSALSIVTPIRHALAMGIDDAVLIDCETNIADSYLKAKILSLALKNKGPFDIIFLGTLSIDHNQSSIGSMLGAFFDIPSATNVSSISYSEKITAQIDVEGGVKHVVRLNTPCVITATKGLNLPRYPKLPNILKAKQKPIEQISITDLGVDLKESKVEFSDFTPPKKRQKVQMIEGSIDGMSEKLIELLKNEAKVI